MDKYHKGGENYMRVIAGSAKRIQLKTLDGFDTRPTTDRIKETLFNMLTPYIGDSRFLDLFSGSGAIGIEALSRGAAEAFFVESNPAAIDCIRTNLANTRLTDRGTILPTEALTALVQLKGGRRFDYIFMDPPYHQGLEKKVLEYLAEAELLEENGTIIVEASRETDFSYLEDWGYVLMKRKEYKTNMHVFIGLEGSEQIC